MRGIQSIDKFFQCFVCCADVELNFPAFALIRLGSVAAAV